TITGGIGDARSRDVHPIANDGVPPRSVNFHAVTEFAVEPSSHRVPAASCHVARPFTCTFDGLDWASALSILAASTRWMLPSLAAAATHACSPCWKFTGAVTSGCPAL